MSQAAKQVGQLASKEVLDWAALGAKAFIAYLAIVNKISRLFIARSTLASAAIIARISLATFTVVDHCSIALKTTFWFTLSAVTIAAVITKCVGVTFVAEFIVAFVTKVNRQIQLSHTILAQTLAAVRSAATHRKKASFAVCTIANRAWSRRDI